MHRFFVRRPLAILVASTLAYSASAQAIQIVGDVLRTAILAQMPSDDYTDTPGSVDPGANPETQPLNRGGLWDSYSLASFYDSARIEAGVNPVQSPPVDSYSPGDTGDNQALVGRPAPLPKSQPITTTEDGSDARIVSYPPQNSGSTTGTGTTSTSAGGTTGSSTTGTGTTGTTTGGLTTGSTTGTTTTGSSTTGVSTGGSTTGSTTGGSTTGGGNPPDPQPQPPGTVSGPTMGEPNNWEGSGPGGGSTAAPGVVSTQTGNRMTTVPITGWKTHGVLPFGLTLYHNAQDNVDVGWGQNWRSSFDMRVVYTGNTVNGNRDYLAVIYPTGKRIPFVRQKTGGPPIWGATFYPPMGYHDMVFAVPGGYTLRTTDQKVYSFDANGYLTSVRDRYGNAYSLAYAASRLQSVSDGSGHSLTLTWGRIATPVNGSAYPLSVMSVKTATNQQWSFLQTGSGSNQTANNVKVLSKVTPPVKTNSSVTPALAFGYNSSCAITSESDLMGYVHTFRYDGSLRLTRFADPLGNATTYTYNPANTVITKPDGGKQTDYYDSGVLRTEQDEAGYSRTYTYDADYNVVQTKDERGNVEKATYDSFGNRTSGQDPRQLAAGVSSRATYNSYNDPMTATDTRGATTTLVRASGNGTLLSVRDPLGNVLGTNTWDPTGLLTGTSAAGASTTATYDSKGRPQTITGPNGSVSLYYADPFSPDKPTSTTDPQGRTTTFTYDEWGRLIGVTRSDGATMSLQLDDMGRVLKVTDWLGHATTYGYDGAGRRTTKSDAVGNVERYAYDSCNRVQTITDGRNKVRTYRYTKRGEVAALGLPDGSGESYQYDGCGDQTSRTNALGQRTAYTYDTANNLTKVAYPSGTPVTYGYDLDGRTTVMTDATGTSGWSFDLADRNTLLSTPQGTLNYGYDAWGRRTSLDQGGGNVTTTNYNAEKLASVVKSPENETTSWSYDGVGRVTAQTLPNGAITAYGYDALDRVNAITHRRANGTVISAEGYQYDAGGNLTYKVVDGVRTDYGYDAIDQLVSESTPGSAISYTYDANGNRLTKTVNGATETYAYDSGDKLLSRSGPAGTFSYGYDACGRTTSVQTPTAGTTTLAYDYEDRMTSIQGAGGAATYAYNGADARVSKATPNGTRTYRRDGVGVTAPVLSDGLATMVPGISERTNGSTKFSHLDRLGTNAKTTDAGGNVVDSRRYDAFGLPISVTNPTGSQKGFASAFGYQEDQESGLKLLGHRYYDSATGRFITRDPAQDGLNWYAYCDNNPLAEVDPTGLQAKKNTPDGPDGHGHKKHRHSKPKRSASDAFLEASLAMALAAMGMATVAGEGAEVALGIMFSAGESGGVESGKGKPKKDPDAWQTPEYRKQKEFRDGLNAHDPRPSPHHEAHHVIEQQMAEIVSERYGHEGISFIEDPVRNGIWWLKHHHQTYAQAYHDALLELYYARNPQSIEEFWEIGRELTQKFQNLP